MRLIHTGLENCTPEKGLNNCLEPSPGGEITDHTLPAQLAAALRMATPSDQAGEGQLRPEFLLTTQALAGSLLSLKTIGIKVVPVAPLPYETEGNKQTFIGCLLCDRPCDRCIRRV